MNNSLELPLKENAVIDSAGNRVWISSYLEWIPGDGENDDILRYVLPDAEKVGSYETNDNLYTSQVSVQAIVSNENQERYQQSTICNWYRLLGGSQWQTAITSLVDYAEPLDITYQLSKAQEHKDIAYQITANAANWLVYKVIISEDEAAQYPLETRYLSAYGIADENINTMLPLLDELYAEYQGKYITVSSAGIIQQGGGLTRWNQEMGLGMLPDLTIQQPQIAESENEIVDAEFSYENSSPEVVTIKAKGYTWSCPSVEASQIAGYKLVLQTGLKSKEILVNRKENGVWQVVDGDSISELSGSNTLTVMDYIAEPNVFYQLSVNAKLSLFLDESGSNFTIIVPNSKVLVDIEESKQLEFDIGDTLLEVYVMPVSSSYQIVD